MADYRDHETRRTSASPASWSDNGRDDSSRHQEDDYDAHAISRDPRQAVRSEPMSPNRYESQDPKFWQVFAVISTLVFCATIVIVVKVYAHDKGMPDKQKHAYETISTGLLLFLGLNFNEAFKSLAEGFETRLLNQRRWSKDHETIIKEIHSFQGNMKLVAFRRTKWWVKVFAATWLAIALLAQIAVAVVSLTYSTQPATGSRGIYLSSGTVNSANLTCYYAYYNNATGCSAETEDITGQSLAHAYGGIADANPCCPYNDTSQVVQSDQLCPYFCNNQSRHQQFAYRFNEYNPDDHQKAFPRFTNRIITASSAPCRVYQQHNFTIMPNGHLQFYYYNDTHNGSILIPGDLDALDGTTYVYRGINRPQDAVRWACGPRCITMWAHRNAGHGETPVHFECDITVSEVSNVTNATRQTISDGLARVAAASIALQGRQSSNGSWTQYQFYPYGSRWETHYLDADRVGANIAEYALGSLAFMARTNPSISHPGQVPHLGTNLTVHWGYLFALLGGIAATHLIIWAVTRCIDSGSGNVGGRRRGGGLEALAESGKGAWNKAWGSGGGVRRLRGREREEDEVELTPRRPVGREGDM